MKVILGELGVKFVKPCLIAIIGPGQEVFVSERNGNTLIVVPLSVFQ